ncbi:hypothetical protein [Phaeovulum sp.]|uniref:hypothetical protein n=1 Tax=Phaeovulum sp. TaxID=2934796 RepID=UPI0039E4C9F6
MSKTNRTKRSVLLSPLAFALSFGAYAGTTVTPAEITGPARPAASEPFDSAVPRDDHGGDADVAWMIDWLESHGA